MEDNIPNVWLESTIFQNISKINNLIHESSSESGEDDFIEITKDIKLQVGDKTITINQYINSSPPEILLKRCRKMTKKLKKLSKKNEAIEELSKCVALSRLVHGNASFEHLSASLKLAENYILLQGNVMRAGEIIRSVVEDSHIETAGNKFSGLLLSASLFLVKSLIQQKNFKTAETDLLTLNQNWKKIKNIFTTDESMCWSLEIQKTAAILYCALGKFRRASECLLGAMEACRILLGQNHSNMIELWQIQARIQRQSRPEDKLEPIKSLRNAYSIADSNSEQTAKMAEITFELAKLLSNCEGDSNLDEAEGYFHESLVLHQKLQKSKTLILLKQSYSCFLMKRNNYFRAVEILKDVVPLCDEVCEENSEEVGETFKLLASALTLTKNYSDALENLKKFVKIKKLSPNLSTAEIRVAERNINKLEKMIYDKK